MGIPVGQYDKEIIRRTKELIESYEGEFTITLLMNSLLSLIVLPKEYSQNREMEFLDSLIQDIKTIESVINKDNFLFHEGSTVGSKVNPSVPNPRDLNQLLRRIRNGISHQHIIPITDGLNKWSGVIFEDYNKNHVRGLHIDFTIAELKEFALYIANSYLSEIKK